MKRIVLCLAVTTFVFTLFASAVWNTPTCVREGNDIQWQGCAAETSDGNIIYTWSDMHSGTRDVYCQAFSNQGIPAWNAPQVLDNSPGNQQFPLITKVSTYELVVCWIDYSTNSMGDIYAQRINQNGTILWDTKKLVCSGSSYKHDLRLFAGNNGLAYIIWEDYRNNNNDLYGQCLNPLGVCQWTENGRQLTFMPYEETDAMVVNDTYNGLLIGYKYKHLGNVYSFINHYNETGSMTWDLPLQIDPEHDDVTLCSVKPFLNNTYIYSWSYTDGPYTHIGIQRIDRSGNEYWDEPVIPDTYVAMKEVRNPRIASTLGSKIGITWETVDQMTGEKSLNFQKLNSNGEFDGNQVVIPLPFMSEALLNHKLEGDLNGGFYIAYQDQSYYYSIVTQIHAFHIGADGSMLFGQQGVEVTENSQYNADFNMNITNNAFHISWDDFRNGEVGIYSQIYTVNGTAQLEPEGHAVITGISGDIDFETIQLLHRSNDSIVLWRDRRDWGYEHIYYQIINEDGVPLLEENGRMLNANLDAYNSHYSVCLGANDEVAVVWEVNAYPDYYVMAQLLDVQGNPLWGENGINLSGMQTNSQIMPVVSFEDGAFYFTWMKYENKEDPNSAILMQKVVNGQVQWMPGGITISTPANWVSELGPVISGRYIAWGEYGEADYTLRVIHFSPDGSPAPGWPQYGRRVDDFEDYSFQYNPSINAVDDGVFLSWLDSRNGVAYQLFGQKLSVDGQTMWNPNSVLLEDVQNDQNLHLQIPTEDGIIYAWSLNSAPTSGIYSSNYTDVGSMAFENPAFFVFNDISSFTNHSCCSFSNGGYLFSAVSNDGISVLHCMYMDENGSLFGTPNGNTIGEPYQYIRSSNLASHQGNAYIAWAEYATRLESFNWSADDIKGLYLQKLNNETVGNEDPTVLPTQVALSQNFPNPFNPETTIRYSLPAKTQTRMEIYNLRGQKVKTLINEQQDAGNHTVTWNGRDDQDSPVASGVYFYRLTTGTKTITRKMVMVK